MRSDGQMVQCWILALKAFCCLYHVDIYIYIYLWEVMSVLSCDTSLPLISGSNVLGFVYVVQYDTISHYTQGNALVVEITLIHWTRAPCDVPAMLVCYDYGGWIRICAYGWSVGQVCTSCSRWRRYVFIQNSWSPLVLAKTNAFLFAAQETVWQIAVSPGWWQDCRSLNALQNVKNMCVPPLPLRNATLA